MTFRCSRARRAVAVAAAASAAVILALAGCGGASSSSPTAAQGRSSAPAPASSPAPASPAAGRSSPASPASGPRASSPAAACAGRQPAKTVSSAGELTLALLAAVPGTTIALAPGTYAGNFQATVSGTGVKPITLCGPRSAILDGGSIGSGYALHLEKANWWRLDGFTLQDAQKGVVTDESSHVLIDGLYVHDTGDEAIHLRDFSSYDTVTRNIVRDTGQEDSFYGEGIYVGSAHSNWCKDSGCQPDGSDHDTLTGNDIATTSAESVDIKEGTTDGLVSGNHFDGTGMNASAATSWVNVKGNHWTITGNTGTHSIGNGLSDHQVYDGWGLGNVFTGNTLNVNGPGFGVYIQSKRLGSVVGCDNTVAGAGSGLTNHGCTSAG
jgi:hypothetical protein